MEQRQAAALSRQRSAWPVQDLVEIAPVGQAGQRIVQRLVFDPRLGRLEFDVARLGKILGALAGSRAKRDLIGDVPVGTDELRRTACGILEEDRRDAQDRADLRRQAGGCGIWR